MANIEEELARLRESNAELERFAAVAAHDLQEPLRKIIGFGDLLLQRAGSTLDEESRGYLSRMVESTRRMAALVEDLLILSRVESDRRPFQPVDLNEVLGAAAADREGEIVIEAPPLPTIMGDPVQMHRLFLNLISNAIKFRAASEPRMEFAATDRGGWVEISASDNGQGFPPEMAERIFQPHERLHGRKYEGTGLGLSICRRIVERHGGTIVADGRPGEGAIFRIRLPRNPDRT
jgi:signal transduction histidine kinase